MIEDTSDSWEGQFIEIGEKHLIWRKKNIGNIYIYRPPKYFVENYRRFTEKITPRFDYLLKINCEAVIAGDMNIYGINMWPNAVGTFKRPLAGI